MRIICWLLGCRIRRVDMHNPFKIVSGCNRCYGVEFDGSEKYEHELYGLYKGNLIKRWLRRRR
jgi:hypothetical protein